MTHAPATCHLSVNGEELLLDPSGVAFWPGEKTLILADIHFEKGSAYARTGQLLPPYDTRAMLRRIEELLARYCPAQVIALGDSFHDQDAENRLDAEEVAMLAHLTQRARWLWVEGNHDPDPPAWIGGVVVPEIAIGGLVFRHIPNDFHTRGEVAGHLHPVARISRHGLSVRRRCFVSDGHRLILPAFGAYAGGLDVRDKAVQALFDQGFAVYALGKEKVYFIGGALRAPEAT